MKMELSKKRILLVFLSVNLFLISQAALPQEGKNEHFGFKFLSSYDEALTIIVEKHGANSIDKLQTRREVGPGRAVPSITFFAAYGNFFSMNTLDFTPNSKKLFSITHSIFFQNELEYGNALVNIQDGLNKKYGFTKSSTLLDKYEDLKELKSHVFSQQWKKSEVTISLFSLHHLKDKPHIIGVTYKNNSAEKIKDKEINQDL